MESIVKVCWRGRCSHVLIPNRSTRKYYRLENSDASALAIDEDRLSDHGNGTSMISEMNTYFHAFSIRRLGSFEPSMSVFQPRLACSTIAGGFGRHPAGGSRGAATHKRGGTWRMYQIRRCTPQQSKTWRVNMNTARIGWLEWLLLYCIPCLSTCQQSEVIFTTVTCTNCFLSFSSA